MNQIKYVVGFMFHRDSIGDWKVVLVRKNRPEWQAGKLNGVGGKIEPGENPQEAMTREFYEETGVWTKDEWWHEFAKLSSPRSKVHCFFSVVDRATYTMAKTVESEAIEKWNASNPNLYQNGVPNLSWLLPLALKTSEEEVFVEAYYP